MESKRININVPIDLYNLIKLEAEKIGIPVSGLFNVAVKEYIKQGSIIDLVKLYELEQQNNK